MTRSHHGLEDYPADRAGTLRIALLYNLASNAPEPPPDAPPDIVYELDHEYNVEAYRAAMQSRGHAMFPMEGNAGLSARLRETPVDTCFNTGEGFRSDAREAQVPALRRHGFARALIPGNYLETRSSARFAQCAAAGMARSGPPTDSKEEKILQWTPA